MDNKISNISKGNYKMLPLSNKVRIEKLRSSTLVLNLKQRDWVTRENKFSPIQCDETTDIWNWYPMVIILRCLHNKTIHEFLKSN